VPEPFRTPLVAGVALGDIARALAGAQARPGGATPGVAGGWEAIRITDVAYRSGDAEAGSLFCCVPGDRVDGHDFAGAAIANGAAALMVQRWLDVPAPQILVPWVRGAMGPAAAVVFGAPSRRMRLVGVTGTNGKTTTTFILESIFRAAGLVPGVIGTTGVRIDGRSVKFDRTTPEAPDVQRLLRGMVDAGVNAAAMEVSSHGLHQHRVDGTEYAFAVFTNLSQDHLDYHADMQEYFEAKARLFTPELTRAGAANVDTEEGRRLVAAAAIPMTGFAIERDADVRAEEVSVSAGGCTFRVDGRRFSSPLRGAFNVMNCLGALVAARAVGIDDDAAEEGIAALPGVPGRLEPVPSGAPFEVLVDYAHTPDSLDNVLRAARGLCEGRLIVVFGCGGDRDRAKRPLMGAAATRLADLSIITSDNPRSESPEAIVKEIERGAEGGGYAIEVDRRAAIRMALEEAGPGDVVVIAGKGHETGQEFADRTIPFDDRVVAAEELAAMGMQP
jgi:UDP-N-acetylmuramoyl-L-alanyl-D-glutamate--2,6-diaminopimelate ligase